MNTARDDKTPKPQQVEAAKKARTGKDSDAKEGAKKSGVSKGRSGRERSAS